MILTSTSPLRRFLAVLAACIVLATVWPALATAAGPKAYVGNFKDDTVSVVDLSNAAVVATIPVAAGPHGMGSSTDGRRVYVGGDGSSKVDVIDVATDHVVRTIEVGKSPHGIAVAPDGRLVLVGVYGEDRVAFIDPSTDAVVATVPVAKPHTIAIAPDGRTAYVASQEPGAFALVVVDLASRSVARTLPLTKPPRDLEFSFDGRALYYTQAGVDAVQVLDPRIDAVVAQIPTGASPHIASRYRGAPGGTVVVQGPGEVLLFDSSRNAPMRSIAVGKQPHWIASTGVDGRVIVTNEGSNDVSLVDLTTGATTRVAVGTAPRKVTVPIAAASPPVAAGASAAGRAVSIRNFEFQPAELRIAAGETVVWTNADGSTHGVAFADGAKGAALMLPDAKFERTFANAGAYDYTCSVHPYMRGRVIVAAP